MFLAFEMFLAGGMVYAGIKTFRKQKKHKASLWISNDKDISTISQDLNHTPLIETFNLAQVEQQINRDFALSSVSLGLSITGSLVYPPLGIASIPLTIYGALPTFENAYESLFTRGRTKTAIVSSIIIIGTLVTNHYTLASVIQWAFHLNQKLLLELNYTYRQFLIYLFGQNSRSIWVILNDVELKIARSELKVGDVVVVNESELIPVDGTIVDGLGLIDMYILTGQSRPVEKQVGDKVFAATNLLSGRICVRTEKAW